MSAALLRQMLEEAGAFLKEEKYQQALDSARRVSQFDARNFQAFMCVGLASFHLQQWEDAETAFHRAAELKPDLPAPWKNLVDVADASGDAKKKIHALEQLIAVFQRGNKVKPCQKWIAELAATALSARLYAKAFDSWFSLVGDRAMSVETTANEELPSPLEIWLQLLDIVQLPAFSLSDSSLELSLAALSKEFFAVASRCSWQDVDSALEGKTDAAIALFMRYHLDEVKATKAGTSAATARRQHLDELATSIVTWFPRAKLPMEYLLLRSEDKDSPIQDERAREIAERLQEHSSRSPMSLMFQGFAAMNNGDWNQARDLIVDGLAGCSASSFHESALCVGAQVVLAEIALQGRDVEGSRSRLDKAKEVAAEKMRTLCCAGPSASVFSPVKLGLLEARALEMAGNTNAALGAYREIVDSSSTVQDAETASHVRSARMNAAELLCARKDPTEALALLKSDDAENPAEMCLVAWCKHLQGDHEAARALFVEQAPRLAATQVTARATVLKRLAIVYWHLGGLYRDEKQYCFTSLLQAAKLAPNDGEVFSWLGQWYCHVAQDIVRAEKCFLKAIALSPQDAIAGPALSELYDRQGKADLNVALWRDLTATPERGAPTWALLRLAQHLVDLNDEEAVGKMHLVLRNEPLNAAHWVAMGHVYRHFDKIVAAQRSYERAIELGEAGWCVQCELARIQGDLHQYDEALVHIESAWNAVCETRSEVSSSAVAVVVSVFADLLLQQAVKQNSEGFHGRAAVNIQRAAELLNEVPPSYAETESNCKLVGDVHTFAFYLSAHDFDGLSGGWIGFISKGRAAYERAVRLAQTVSSTRCVAQAHYDVAVSCWYEARARSQSSVDPFGVRRDVSVSKEVEALLAAAQQHISQALKLDASLGLAWNALGVVTPHPLAKQFSWARAIQAGNCDAAWANLGMLYVTQSARQSGPRGASLEQLAREAFLHLQAVNPNSPAMWIGYGLLCLRQTHAAPVRDATKARESFQCALEMGSHADALRGFVLSALLELQSTHSSHDRPTLESLLFAIKKFTEREREDPLAWQLRSLIQFHLGLLNEASVSIAECQRLLTSENKHASVDWNALLIKLGNEWQRQQHRRRCGQNGEAKDSAAVMQAIDTVLQLAPMSDRYVRAAVMTQRALTKQDLALALSTLQDAILAGNAEISSSKLRLVSAAFAVCAQSSHDSSTADARELLVSTCRAVVVDAVSKISEASAMKPEIQSVIRAMELHDRRTGHLFNFVNSMDASSPELPTLALRLGLARLDLQDPAFVESRTPGLKETPADERAVLAALRLILTGECKTLRGRHVVRMQPWNPYGYVLAAFELIAQALLGGDGTASTDEPKQKLRRAQTLAASGIRVAQTSETSSSLVVVILQYALALIHRHDGENSSAASVVSDAISALKASAQPETEKLLWEARLLALVDSASSLESYQRALRLTGDQHGQVPLLIEIAGQLEAWGHLNSALHVWKIVSGLWKQAAPSDGPSDSLNVPSFVSSLRLALLNGKAQNAKWAKKFCKSATAALAPSDEASEAARVAHFVENVIATKL
ncbi:hypothetical protein ATCC90586_004310 [Pythium insidiosum]|nr:hypothetical protein ATCC90586_004310 [Pythium insidiosum]